MNVRAIVISCIFLSLLGGCASSPDVPAGASVIYHGPMQDMTGNLPVGPGTIYVVDAANGKVVGASYIAGPEQTNAKPWKIDGLKEGRKYTFYFLKASETKPAP